MPPPPSPSRRPARRRSTEGLHERIYAVVARVPRGRVATYGQVAELAGLGRQARLVGYALNALPEGRDDVPWHRIINAQGRVSPRAEPGWVDFQRQLLEEEGVVFDARGRISLVRHAWRPRQAAR
ncbi:MAG: MGMT family protein [Candidatus Eiseniibacteriota bacterium]|jgi:methylated-DNA-protein-cysteine methyltransferase-like protein